ncbi:MAG: hypothetical protein COW11_04885 [Candidatus Omnitrophica bacterium CG12_big_fil_rev_8_21_14_0_65_43_15]|uniref:Small-conductance mechanosensitive ion channel n=1 Tax=Candidatus Taenaricola geysiri TaxID=1974752 RepID=A0A2J0LG01_9BACT|nr:MAG: hypothetical protein COW11_04885 [Candidatus Omnitrophica bacterium CG12_big_fil_rev_8_21_14_0_65_43_15]
MSPAKAIMYRFTAILPKIIVISSVLIVGTLLAVAAKAIVTWLMKTIGLGKGLKNIKADKMLKNAGINYTAGEFIAEIAFYLVISGSLLLATFEYKSAAVGIIAGTLLGIMPKVIIASLLLVLGTLLSVLASGFVKVVLANSGEIVNAESIAKAVKLAVMVLVIMGALRFLGIGVIFGPNARDILLGGVCLAAAIAVGLGAKEIVTKALSKITKE